MCPGWFVCVQQWDVAVSVLRYCCVFAETLLRHCSVCVCVWVSQVLQQVESFGIQLYPRPDCDDDDLLCVCWDVAETLQCMYVCVCVDESGTAAGGVVRHPAVSTAWLWWWFAVCLLRRCWDIAVYVCVCVCVDESGTAAGGVVRHPAVSTAWLWWWWRWWLQGTVSATQGQSELSHGTDSGRHMTVITCVWCDTLIQLTCLFHCWQWRGKLIVSIYILSPSVVSHPHPIPVDFSQFHPIVIISPPPPSPSLCGLQGCKNRPAPFPGRMFKKQLNQALSVLSHSLGFLWLCVLLLTRDSF